MDIAILHLWAIFHELLKNQSGSIVETQSEQRNQSNVWDDKEGATMRPLERMCKIYLDNSGKYASVGRVGLECRESHNSGSTK